MQIHLKIHGYSAYLYTHKYRHALASTSARKHNGIMHKRNETRQNRANTTKYTTLRIIDITVHIIGIVVAFVSVVLASNYVVCASEALVVASKSDAVASNLFRLTPH